MSLIEWNDEFNLGIEEVDGEHRALVALINALHDAMSAGARRVDVKDEGRLPTGSFKARGIGMAVSMAKELGLTRLAMPTNGNAGGAWAAYCAQAGIRSVIVMPKDAPPIPRGECTIAGADLSLGQKRQPDQVGVVSESRRQRADVRPELLG